MPKLERSPLVLVLSQVRFSPVLKMQDYVPEIQEALRNQGFPGYRAEQIQQVVFGPQLRAEHSSRWVFLGGDKREAVVLASDFVVYETSRYDVFQTFIDRFLPVVQLLAKQVKPAYVEQTGLRYVDLIRPAEGKAARDFLRENLRGLSNQDLEAEETRHQFIIQAKTSHGELNVRSFENTGGQFMPPDLLSTDLDFDVKLEESEMFRILDFDHISKAQFDFDADAIGKKLHGLHSLSEKAFHAATTPEAIEFWKSKGK